MKTTLALLTLLLFGVSSYAQNVRISEPIGTKTAAKSVPITFASDATQPPPSGSPVPIKATTPIPITATTPIPITATTPIPVTTAEKQYTGVPSTFAIGTTDATVFTLAAGEVGFIQNLDDAALAVKKGASASTTSLSFILAAGTAADDGKGGAIVIKDWVGAVSVAAMTGSPRYAAWKQN